MYCLLPVPVAVRARRLLRRRPATRVRQRQAEQRPRSGVQRRRADAAWRPHGAADADAGAGRRSGRASSAARRSRWPACRVGRHGAGPLTGASCTDRVSLTGATGRPQPGRLVRAARTRSRQRPAGSSRRGGRASRGGVVGGGADGRARRRRRRRRSAARVGARGRRSSRRASGSTVGLPTSVPAGDHRCLVGMAAFGRLGQVGVHERLPGPAGQVAPVLLAAGGVVDRRRAVAAADPHRGAHLRGEADHPGVAVLPDRRCRGAAGRLDPVGAGLGRRRPGRRPAVVARSSATGSSVSVTSLATRGSIDRLAGVLVRVDDAARRPSVTC